MVYPESEYFEWLKMKIVETMKQSHPEIPGLIQEWKGQHIIDFQSDLRFKVKENISEKWFYTYMKSTSRKLPRIDILNFLSRYVGCNNWDDFKLKNKPVKRDSHSDRSNRVFYLVPFLTVVILLLLYAGFNLMYTQEYTFCFYDSDTKKPINNSIIEISILEEGETPVSHLCNSEGCFKIKQKERLLTFVVETPYYHKDTVVRTLNKFNRTENIRLKMDDYAAMIHYFSTSSVQDWLKRRENLNQIFSDSAKIYQVLEGTIGMEMYNKWEFINKMTMPANSLRDLEVIDTQYNGDKIIRLRFKQNNSAE